MAFLDDLIQAVREWDAARPRSTQSAVGWSEIGGCRSYLGYRLAGEWASDTTDTWGAIRGTAIHEFLAHVLAGRPGITLEMDTVYRGVPGHADLVMIDGNSLGDFKTTSLANSRLWRSTPTVLWEKRVQVQGYAAGLVEAGKLREDGLLVRLIVIPIGGTFDDWWMWEEPFDRTIADWGADRLDSVKALLEGGEPLPKDKPWTWCQSWCEFFSLCRLRARPDMEEITDPETQAAVERYGTLGEQIRALTKERDGLRPVVEGLRGVAGDWRVFMSKPGDPVRKLDEAEIRAHYAERDIPVPEIEAPGRAPALYVQRTKK